MTEVRQTVIELLEQPGSSREARQYLKQFSRIEETRLAGVPVEKRDGLRVTTEEVMTVARPVIYRANASLVDALEARGAR